MIQQVQSTEQVRQFAKEVSQLLSEVETHHTDVIAETERIDRDIFTWIKKTNKLHELEKQLAVLFGKKVPHKTDLILEQQRLIRIHDLLSETKAILEG